MVSIKRKSIVFSSVVFVALALGTSQMAFAEIANVTANGEGSSKDGAVAAAQKNLEANCKSFGGKPVAGSLKVTFEKPLSNGKFYADATMACDFTK